MEKEICRTFEGKYIEGPLIITPNIYLDERGFFYESWNKESFDNLLEREINFVQDNYFTWTSFSSRAKFSRQISSLHKRLYFRCGCGP